MYIKTCQYCNIEYNCESRHKFAAHTFNCINNPKKIARMIKSKDRYKLHTFNCVKCNNTYTVNITDTQLRNKDYSKHCTKSCANTHVLSEQTKIKISIAINSKLTCPIYYKNCIICNKLYTVKYKYSKKCCSKECVSKQLSILGVISGRKSAALQSKNKRSKNEKEFANLCISKFKNVECNIPIFNGWDADVIIHDLKIAVLWNGKWHYEKITRKHSVQQVQNRDQIKTKEILACGYTPYIIKDLGIDKNIVNKEFEKFVAFIGNSPIISPYERDVIIFH